MASFNGKANFARIASLVMQEGTNRMRVVTLHNLPPRQTLSQALQNNASTFKYLKRKGILSEVQYSMLYPFDGNMENFDMTLWMVLARNLTSKGTPRVINWRMSPWPYETLWQHDFIRLKEIRNYLFHASSPELTDEKFQEIREELITVLTRLGSSSDVINAQLSRDLDPQQTCMYVMKLKQQYMEEKWARTARRRRHCKCLIGVLSVLALVIICGVSVLIYWFVSQPYPCSKHMIRVPSENGVVNFMPRSGWGAKPSKHPLNPLPIPVQMVGIFHSAMVQNDCSATGDCCDVVRYLQEGAMDGKFMPNVSWPDISYNYLIDNDGVVYEGVGSRYSGSAVWQRNSEILSIALLGNHVCVPPSRTALTALYAFLGYIESDDPLNSGPVQTPIIQNNYTIYGHCQVNLITPDHPISFPDAPGAAIMQEIRYWDHWRDDNITQCHVDKDCLTSYTCCKKTCSLSSH